MKLRKLTQIGLNRFSNYLKDLRNDGSIPIPEYLLTDNDSSDNIGNAPDIRQVKINTKREAAEYLIDTLSSINHNDIMNDAGLWSWLGLFFFDKICPASAAGNRHPHSDYFYIFAAGNWNRRYRHLLAAPYIILKEFPEYNRIFLDTPLNVHGDLIEKIALGRLYLTRIPAVREMIDKLYFDKKNNKAKIGLFPKKENAKPGDLGNRLPIRIQQLQKTYDISSLNGNQLIELLGDEFKRWLD